jgi:hypothetical protein
MNPTLSQASPTLPTKDAMPSGAGLLGEPQRGVPRAATEWWIRSPAVTGWPSGIRIPVLIGTASQEIKILIGRPRIETNQISSLPYPRK